MAVFGGALFAGSILGIVFGYIARRRIRSDPSKEGASLATAGIVLGWVGLGLSILAVTLLVAWVNGVVPEVNLFELERTAQG